MTNFEESNSLPNLNKLESWVARNINLDASTPKPLGQNEVSALYTGKTNLDFPSRLDLPMNQYPDVTPQFEDFKHGFLKELSGRAHWAGKQGVQDLYQQNFKPGGNWDLNVHPDFPGIGQNGLPQYARFKNRVVDGSFLKNFAAGLGLSATDNYPNGASSEHFISEFPHLPGEVIDDLDALHAGNKAWYGLDDWTTPQHSVLFYNGQNAASEGSGDDSSPTIYGGVSKDRYYPPEGMPPEPSNEPPPDSLPDDEEGDDEPNDPIPAQANLHALDTALRFLHMGGLMKQNYMAAASKLPGPQKAELASRFLDSMGSFGNETLKIASAHIRSSKTQPHQAAPIQTQSPATNPIGPLATGNILPKTGSTGNPVREESNPQASPVENVSLPDSNDLPQPSADQIARRNYTDVSRGGFDRTSAQNPIPDVGSLWPVKDIISEFPQLKNDILQNIHNLLPDPNKVQHYVQNLYLQYRAYRAATGEARDIIKQFEQLKLVAYKKDGDNWTIGYGHTGPDVYPGQVITQEQAEKLLTQDIIKAGADVNTYVKVPLTDNQFNALVSFDFNIGSGLFSSSTLLEKLNREDYTGAADQFQKWIYGPDKRIWNGLVIRRKKERILFEKT